MKKINAYCLLNHELTENQVKELREKFGTEKIVYPPEELSKAWSQIAPLPELDYGVIKSVVEWISVAGKNDVLIVQGEFGSTFCVVDYALKKGLVPVHAVTKRVATESRNGEMISRQYIFTHCCFRRYRYFEGEYNIEVN